MEGAEIPDDVVMQLARERAGLLELACGALLDGCKKAQLRAVFQVWRRSLHILEEAGDAASESTVEAALREELEVTRRRLAKAEEELSRTVAGRAVISSSALRSELQEEREATAYIQDELRRLQDDAKAAGSREVSKGSTRSRSAKPRHKHQAEEEVLAMSVEDLQAAVLKEQALREDLEMQVEAMHEELREWKNCDIAQVARELRKEQEDNAELHEELEKMREKLRQSAEFGQMLVSRSQELENENERLAAKVNDAMQKRQDAESELEDALLTKDVLSKELESVQEENEKLQAQLAEATAREAEMTTTLTPGKVDHEMTYQETFQSREGRASSFASSSEAASQVSEAILRQRSKEGHPEQRPSINIRRASHCSRGSHSSATHGMVHLDVVMQSNEDLIHENEDLLKKLEEVEDECDRLKRVVTDERENMEREKQEILDACHKADATDEADVRKRASLRVAAQNTIMALRRKSDLHAKESYFEESMVCREEYKNDMALCEEECEELVSQVAALTDENAICSENCMTLETWLDEARVQLEANQEETEFLQVQTRQLQERLDMSELSGGLFASQASMGDQDVLKQSGPSLMLSGSVAATEGAGEETFQQLQELSEQLRQENTTLQFELLETVDLKDQEKVLTQELLERDATIVESQRLMIRLEQSQQAQGQINSEALQEEYEEAMEKQRTRFEVHAQELRSEKEALRQHAQELGLENNALLQQAQELVNEQKKLAGRAEDLQKQKNVVFEQAEVLLRESEALGAEKQGLEVEVTDLRKQVWYLNGRVEQLQEENESLGEALEGESHTLSAELREVSRKCVALTSELAEEQLRGKQDTERLLEEASVSAREAKEACAEAANERFQKTVACLVSSSMRKSTVAELEKLRSAMSNIWVVSSCAVRSLDDAHIMETLLRKANESPNLWVACDWPGSANSRSADACKWDVVQGYAEQFANAGGLDENSVAFQNLRKWIVSTVWFQLFAGQVKRALRAAAQLSSSSDLRPTIWSLCIEGGPISRVEANLMPIIVREAMAECRDTCDGISFKMGTIRSLEELDDLLSGKVEPENLMFEANAARQRISDAELGLPCHGGLAELRSWVLSEMEQESEAKAVSPLEPDSEDVDTVVAAMTGLAQWFREHGLKKDSYMVVAKQCITYGCANPSELPADGSRIDDFVESLSLEPRQADAMTFALHQGVLGGGWLCDEAKQQDASRRERVQQLAERCSELDDALIAAKIAQQATAHQEERRADAHSREVAKLEERLATMQKWADGAREELQEAQSKAEAYEIFTPRQGAAAAAEHFEAVPSTRIVPHGPPAGLEAWSALVVVSGAMKAPGMLLEAVRPGVGAFVYDWASATPEAILQDCRQVLGTGKRVRCLAILANSVPGGLSLARDFETTREKLATSPRMRHFWSSLAREVLEPSGRLTILGCEGLLGEEGRRLVADLESLLGAKVELEADMTQYALSESGFFLGPRLGRWASLDHTASAASREALIALARSRARCALNDCRLGATLRGLRSPGDSRESSAGRLQAPEPESLPNETSGGACSSSASPVEAEADRESAEVVQKARLKSAKARARDALEASQLNAALLVAKSPGGSRRASFAGPPSGAEAIDKAGRLQAMRSVAAHILGRRNDAEGCRDVFRFWSTFAASSARDRELRLEQRDDRSLIARLETQVEEATSSEAEAKAELEEKLRDPWLQRECRRLREEATQGALLQRRAEEEMEAAHEWLQERKQAFEEEESMKANLPDVEQEVEKLIHECEQLRAAESSVAEANRQLYEELQEVLAERARLPEAAAQDSATVDAQTSPLREGLEELSLQASTEKLGQLSQQEEEVCYELLRTVKVFRETICMEEAKNAAMKRRNEELELQYAQLRAGAAEHLEALESAEQQIKRKTVQYEDAAAQRDAAKELEELTSGIARAEDTERRRLEDKLEESEKLCYHLRLLEQDARSLARAAQEREESAVRHLVAEHEEDLLRYRQDSQNAIAILQEEIEDMYQECHQVERTAEMAMSVERCRAQAEVEEATRVAGDEKSRLQQELEDNFKEERQKLRRNWLQMEKELRAECDDLRKEAELIEAELQDSQSQCHNLDQERATLQEEAATLLWEHSEGQREKEALKAEYQEEQYRAVMVHEELWSSVAGGMERVRSLEEENGRLQRQLSLSVAAAIEARKGSSMEKLRLREQREMVEAEAEEARRMELDAHRLRDEAREAAEAERVARGIASATSELLRRDEELRQSRSLKEQFAKALTAEKEARRCAGMASQLRRLIKDMEVDCDLIS
eukprot:TRINITY_DN68605_c0_g1_i1.p1 TRINITY_DN68605_c0_g1~~TRINITY_DN68605_c0_g1_i1.p1  ORF type:complete len:2290 (+),score=741.02 TRINITY_DN68605_c0_g1_i1:191-7060(+)